MSIQLGAVKAFRGHAVEGGVVQVKTECFIRHLDETYPDVNVCNITESAGNVLYGAFPLRFDKMRTDYAIELQDALRSQLKSANDVDIDFH